MKFVIEIDDAEIREVVIDKVTKTITDNIMHERFDARIYREEIKAACKKAVSDNFDALCGSAVRYAGDKIAKSCSGCPLAQGRKESE